MFKRFRLMNVADGLGDEGNTPPTNTPPENTPPAEFVGPAWAKELKLEGVEEDILKDPALGPIQNVSSLVKSYVHAQRQIGKKGVIIPSENSTKEEWDTFFSKVGVPLEEAKYQEAVKFKQDSGFDDGFNKEFAKLAHEARILPNQAVKLHEFFSTKTKLASDKFVNDLKEKGQQELDALRDELGQEAYDVKKSKATKFLTENADKDFLKYLGESGLGKNAKVVKAFMNMADKFYKEDALPNDGDKSFGLTLDEMQKEINMAYADPKGAYLNSKHPDHKRKVDEIQKYFAKIEQNKNKR